MFECMNLSGSTAVIAPLFFIVYFALVHYIVLNLFVAAVLSSFAEEKERQDEIARARAELERQNELMRLRKEAEEKLAREVAASSLRYFDALI